MMKRRDFLKTASAAAATPVLLNGIPVQGMEHSKLLQLLSDSNCEDHVLVLIQLNGGNDGLHTVVPLDQYDKLQAARPDIIIPENSVQKLTGRDDLGFHKRMSQLNDLYSDGKLTVVQNVGYPNQNFSHFRSTDIWLMASDHDEVLDTGWLGRYMDCDHPTYPESYPNNNFPDPLGIQTGVFVSPAFLGPNASFGHAIEDPDEFYQLIEDEDNTSTDTPYGHELAFIRQTARTANAYNLRIQEAASNQNNISTLYPPNRQNRLADQLKIVARMIGGGLKTKLYMVSLPGFDTHASQVDSLDKNEGMHGDLLQMVSEAMNAFQDDIEKMGVSNKVLTMTFSEFGRRIASNGSAGTDHGAAAPIIMMSSAIEGSIIGNNPVVPDNVRVQDNLPMEIDFRSVYATVLRDWFCLDEEKIKKVLFKDFPFLPLKTTGVRNYNSDLAKIKMFPNPAVEFIYLETELTSFHLEIFDNAGMRKLDLMVKGSGALKQVNISTLPPGLYHLRISNPSGHRVMKLVKK
ncbi:DUF1501 domain-containing protein [Luteibaculum oceani]|uniref:DUF1501 domain-containing protein n=1 Tax=Luteibaculum oceani TaxID=1294296 RepID=A0A5C6UWX7_9FLAO|nr:DUF1501 domain-containing protein [Luteibaculum oceani]TXC77090.1 DUF1501 domain-containing protein [Luteibaculum oceani]